LGIGRLPITVAGAFSGSRIAISDLP